MASSDRRHSIQVVPLRNFIGDSLAEGVGVTLVVARRQGGAPCGHAGAGTMPGPISSMFGTDKKRAEALVLFGDKAIHE